MNIVAQTPSPSVWQNLHNFSMGVTCALLLVAALIFLRFYRKSGDRLFLFFSAAFAILGVNRMFFVLVDAPDESRTVLYAVRLLAFALILFAIIDKNRRPKLSSPPKSAAPRQDRPSL
jgi:peptidoglycan/LPS O-acetylase OafA/YrhL